MEYVKHNFQLTARPIGFVSTVKFARDLMVDTTVYLGFIEVTMG